MNVIYGVKKKTISDLFRNCSITPAIKNFCIEGQTLIYKALHDVQYSLRMPESFGCCEIKIDFFPLNLICKIMEKKEAISLIRCSKDIKEDVIDELCNKIETDFKTNVDIIINSDSKFGLSSVSIAFIYLGDSLSDILICIPKKVISLINKKQEYVCDSCFKTISVENDKLPNFMYEIKDGTLHYFCKKCSADKEKVVHVGDFFL